MSWPRPPDYSDCEWAAFQRAQIFREPLTPPPTDSLTVLNLPQSTMFGESEQIGPSTRRRSSLDDIDETDEVPTRWVGDDEALTQCQVDMIGPPGLQLSGVSDPSTVFDGTLDELAALQGRERQQSPLHFVPLRNDSGFEESEPPQKNNSDLADCHVIQPESFWTPDSPVSIDVLLPVYDCYPGASRLQVTIPPPSWASTTESSPGESSGMAWSSDLDDELHSSPCASLSDLPDFSDYRLQEFSRTSQSMLEPTPLNPLHLWDDDLGSGGSYHGHPGPMDIDGQSPPSSPRPGTLELELPGFDSDYLRQDLEMSHDDDEHDATPSEPPPLLCDGVHDLLVDSLTSPSPYDTYQQTHLLHSPHPRHSCLPMDDISPIPCSPSPQLLSLPLLPESEPECDPTINPNASSGTISPSLLGAPDNLEGLGLLLNPDSVDPPPRSPSPSEDDDLQLLEEFDSTSSDLDAEEFLALRAVHRRALAAEHAAKQAEEGLGARISSTTSLILQGTTSTTLPPLSLDLGHIQELDAEEKRRHRSELHRAMDERAEARRVRKCERQRSKEVGALMDLKTGHPVSGVRGSFRSISQLVAGMLLRRRDVLRPLANRRALPRTYACTALQHSVSAEDLVLQFEEMDVDED